MRCGEREEREIDAKAEINSRGMEGRAGGEGGNMCVGLHLNMRDFGERERERDRNLLHPGESFGKGRARGREGEGWRWRRLWWFWWGKENSWP